MRSVRIFSVPKGVQRDFASKNIVTQAVISRAYAPLSFTELRTGELLDLLASVAVVGIVAENLNQFFEGANRGGVFPGDRLEFPLERAVRGDGQVRAATSPAATRDRLRSSRCRAPWLLSSARTFRLPSL